MLHFLTNGDRKSNSHLFHEMFRSRAELFYEKLGWSVEVRDGLEFDDHDLHSDPLYVVKTDPVDKVIGSLRLLPTTGDTMIGREFAYMFDEPVDVRSPVIWECTRFCVPHDERRTQHVAVGQTASDLLIGLCQFCLSNGIEQILGLYERPMTRIYRRIGWSPVQFAKARPEAGDICAGLWDATEAALDNMRRLAQRESAVAAA